MGNAASFWTGAVVISGVWYDIVKDDKDAGIIGAYINIRKGVRSVGGKKDMTAVGVVCNYPKTYAAGNNPQRHLPAKGTVFVFEVRCLVIHSMTAHCAVKIMVCQADVGLYAVMG